MASHMQHPHFLLVPLMSQSHLIPFTDMAKLLALRGIAVTIIITPLNAIRFQTIIDQAIHSNLNIQFIPLPFPCQQAGLPQGCENMDSIPSPDLKKQFFLASSMLQQPLENLLGHLEPPPSCIIASVCLPWTRDVAVKFKIPWLVFHGISCFTLLCGKNIERSDVLKSVAADSEPFEVPGMPDKIEFTKAQLPPGFQPSSDGSGFVEKMRATAILAQGVVVNSFEDLEPNYLLEYKKLVNKVWCIGPVSLCNKEMSDKFGRGNKTSIDENQCLKWLDSRKPKSVIYACFGSLCHFSTSQLIEIGLGLEASNRPFVWIIRQSDCSFEIEEWLLEERYEERIKGRGLIIRGWAPQVLILSHPAAGGFLTHSGWNSTIEAICSGVPMITWPMFAEQFYNEKLVVQVLRIGVRIGVEVIVQWGEEEKAGALVKRNQIKEAVDKLMDEGKEGEERRERARKLGELAKMAVEEGGSSHLNTTLLIQDIMEQVNQNGPTKEIV
uniref:Glycosyltransferase n=1 Tax=Vitis vinifera TaxID=29760 RepID=A5BA40_VITVI|nr:hypothetical protein VITISV_041695 [Vitis vinifera]